MTRGVMARAALRLSTAGLLALALLLSLLPQAASGAPVEPSTAVEQDQSPVPESLDGVDDAAPTEDAAAEVVEVSPGEPGAADGRPLGRRVIIDGESRSLIDAEEAARLGLRKAAPVVTPGELSTHRFALVNVPEDIEVATIELVGSWVEYGESDADYYYQTIDSISGVHFSGGAANVDFTWAAPDDVWAGYQLLIVPEYESPLEASFGLTSEWIQTDALGEDEPYEADFSGYASGYETLTLQLRRGKGVPSSVTGATLLPYARDIDGWTWRIAEVIEVPIGTLTLHHYPVFDAKTKYRITGYGIDDEGTAKTDYADTPWLSAAQLQAGLTTTITLAKPALKKGKVKLVGAAYHDGLEHGGLLDVSWSGFRPTSPLGEYRYQWYRNGARISEATESSYKVTLADRGKRLSAKVTVTFEGAGRSVSATSSAVTVKPGFAMLPDWELDVDFDSGALTATAVHQTPIASPQNTGVTVAYQWYRAGKAVKRATGKTYRLSNADAGALISVRATPKRSGYVSLPIEWQGSFSLAAEKAPKVLIEGEGYFQGQELRVDPESYGDAIGYFEFFPWGSTIEPEYLSGARFQWLRNGIAIKNATGEYYLLTAADVGKRISIRVTVETPGLLPSIETSEPSAKVLARWIDPGTLKLVSHEQPAAKRLFTVNREGGATGVKLAYQWYYDGRAVKGATKSSYLRSGDPDIEKVSVRVTLTKAGHAKAVYRLAAY